MQFSTINITYLLLYLVNQTTFTAKKMCSVIKNPIWKSNSFALFRILIMKNQLNSEEYFCIRLYCQYKYEINNEKVNT